jgi:hypothetical protein
MFLTLFRTCGIQIPSPSQRYSQILISFWSPRDPFLAPRADVRVTCTHFIIKQLLYMFYFHICFTSGIWFECAGPHSQPPSRHQSLTPLASPGIYSKLAYNSTLCSQLHSPIIPLDIYPQDPHTHLCGTITYVAFKYHHLDSSLTPMSCPTYLSPWHNDTHVVLPIRLGSLGSVTPQSKNLIFVPPHHANHLTMDSHIMFFWLH